MALLIFFAISHIHTYFKSFQYFLLWFIFFSQYFFKFDQLYGHKMIISSLSKLYIESNYAIWDFGLKSHSLAVNWSQSSHLVSFWTKHQIKKKLFSLVKVMLSFGHRAKHQTKISLIKVEFWECCLNVRLSFNLVTQSFQHFLN